MKTAQWIVAVVVLAAMVFVLTFAMNYLGNSGGNTPKRGEEMLRLDFPGPIYPEVSLPPLLCEHRQGASCDYWFRNTFNKEVKVGLVHKSCKCARVELSVLPEYRQAPLTTYTAERVAAALPSILGGPVVPLELLAVATWHETEGVRRVQADAAQGVTLTTDGPPAKVPANALGWVRLSWDTDKAEPRVLGVELWTDDPANLVTTKLETRVHILDPLLAPTDADLGTAALRDLPLSTPVYAYSCTRDSMRIKAEIVRDGRKDASDTFEVTEPVPMTSAECRELQRRSNIPYVRCGWRMNVIVRPMSPDGTTPVEFGRYRRIVTISSLDDEGVTPQKMALTGTVTGPVVVGDRDEDGAMLFGTFPSLLGKTQKITLQSDEAGLELEVDKARTPDFLEVSPLEKPDVGPTGHRTWVLKARVLPGKVTGSFPNPDDPAFRDSAIYIKTKGDKPRSIRIPVRGSALIN